MKKIILVLLLFSFLISIVALGFSFYILSFLGESMFSAKFLHDSNNNSTIVYEGEDYYMWYDISETYIKNKFVFDSTMYPYSFIEWDFETCEKIYIQSREKKLFPIDITYRYFCFCNSKNDIDSNFLVAAPGKLDRIFIKKDFDFPTLNSSEVNEIWMSLSSTDEDNIKDITIVNHIVECAKSNGELALDKDVYEQIKSTSWDNHCFYLKYKGYPLVEEFHIEETEDGRYIVSQYTASEYDTVYLDDHKARPAKL